MQNLRKKTSPLKYKNETSRFMGEGVSFKAKLIGILEVSEARGDRMCQEALSDLKMAIRAAGEHKQRITITIAIDGLRLRDEKTGDSLYHHPVHKISFIAQDMTDSRAFGYIFGSPDTGHRFFGIKTDKAASQVVIAMRDLFQVVFALKKKEIELAKQHLERSSPLFSDGSNSYAKQLQSVPHISIKSSTEPKPDGTNSDKNSGAAVADLVDLELELNSLQQGLTQMERITPLDPFNSRDDPFGDSFITYPVKPILPPPPGSGRDRSSRNSDSSSVFSPKTPHTNTGDSISDKKNFTFSQDFSTSHEDHSSGDWFAPSANINIFTEPSTLPVLEPTKDEKHEKAKQEIMSQFDVFTELDPLGTGRSKPYIDRKHFFQELKNPPKKALNELTSNTTQEQPMFTTSFNQNTTNSHVTPTFRMQGVFTVDPFEDDPFVKEDPFADSDFSKQDPFENEFSLFSNTQATSTENVCFLKTPKKSTSEKPKSPLFKHNTLDINFQKSGDSLQNLHENKSLDISSETECAPEPPPRPSVAAMQITPPPLPPKKMFNDLTSRPPPRPPYHLDESPYDFIEKYETAKNGEVGKDAEKNPPLPLPARKAKFDVDFGSPERPKKPSNLSSNQEEDYLTPITFTEQNTVILLPPPQKSTKRLSPNANIPEQNNLSNDNLTDSSSLDGLDITLSQLTLTGLNELAQKLHIPASQLSNMTLVQLTNYLSNYIRTNATKPVPVNNEENLNVNNTNNFDVEFPSFKADFAANFNNLNNKSGEVSYDRYAVFRELMQEEIKQTKIDSEPEEILEEKVKMESATNNSIILDLQPLKKDSSETEDKYAALREIVENELKQCEILKPLESQKLQENLDIQETKTDNENEVTLVCENAETETTKTDENSNADNVKTDQTEVTTPQNAPVVAFAVTKENLENKTSTPPDSPVTPIVTEKMVAKEGESVPNTTATRHNSGSLSDIISGSSPEIDGASNMDVDKKNSDPTGESWAVFDQNTVSVDSAKEKQPLHSEEGISPWSSDSKEFGNGSPSEMRSKDSSGPDLRLKKGKDQDGWWDTSAEPGHYCSSNRRSTDSYDEEYYDCYDKPRRRRHHYNWQHGGHGAGGHSSSSRDVSPWEEEPRGRDVRDTRNTAYRHSRGHPFDKYRDRRSHDSWDEDEDDYEYENNDRRFYWPGRHGSRETEREGRQSAISRNLESDRRDEDWTEEGRHRRRRETRDRRCCPDWEQGELEKPMRYGATRRSNPEPPNQGKWRSRKHEDRFYPRESQESPWEDEYNNDPEHIYYTAGKRTSKPRPSSASEIDRKTGEIKSKHFLQTGGSDGEWDKRHKPSRRSRSRDSQYSEPGYRYKCEQIPSSRNIHRSRTLSQTKTTEPDFPDKKMSDTYRKRKKIKDTSPKVEENVMNTFPRRSGSRGKMVPSDDFNTSEEIITKSRLCQKFNFENDFDISEVESPTILNPVKTLRQRTMFEKQSSLTESKGIQRGGSLKESKLLGRFHETSKSMFEDDFSPSEKTEELPEDSICSIKEETDRDENDEFEEPKFRSTTNGRKLKLGRNRIFGNLNLGDDKNLKKSDSVNIFAREDDPFDDDFFYDESAEQDEELSPRNIELRWSEDFKNT